MKYNVWVQRNVERIEVIQGAASAKYGSDAVGGVVNIITKKHKETIRTIMLKACVARAMAMYFRSKTSSFVPILVKWAS